MDDSRHDLLDGDFFSFAKARYLTAGLFGAILLGVVLNTYMNYVAFDWNIIVNRNIFYIGTVLVMGLLFYLKLVNINNTLIVISYTILLGYLCILPVLFDIKGFSFYDYFLEIQFLVLIFGILLSIAVKPYHDLILGVGNLMVSMICVIVIDEFKVETYLFYVSIVSAKCIICYLIFSRVIALRKQMKSYHETITQQNVQLLELTNFRKDIIKVIAHDLRNPIQQISSLLELLPDSNTVAERSEIMSFVNKSVNNAYNMLEELLLWAMQSDTSLKEFSKLNMEEVIGSIENQLKEQLSRKELKIVKRINSRTEILYSKNVIEAVTRNLLINAIKFSPAKNEIEVSFENNNSNFSLKVFNRATGVAVENIEKFNAGNNNITSVEGTAKEKGSGNGLVVCREMLNKNNGDLTLKVEKDGVLATVFVHKAL